MESSQGRKVGLEGSNSQKKDIEEVRLGTEKPGKKDLEKIWKSTEKGEKDA